jgi:polyether ionophore transport system permease protein
MSTGDATIVVAGHAWRMVRRGALIWGAVFALLIFSSISGYESSYGTPAERAHLAMTLGGNAGLQALFGQARDLFTTQGFVAWRTAGVIAPVAAIWGLLSATRLMRGEEEAGRWEILLAGAVTPGRAALACLAALGGAIGAAWALTAATAVGIGVLGYGFPLTGALFLALALVCPAAIFMAIGAVASQLAATRRQAATIGAAVFGLALILRMAADSSSGADWLHWSTPLGWVEELHPLTGSQPAALLPILALVTGLCGLAVWLASRRDLGASLLPARDRAAPDPSLLGSTTAQALRSARGNLIGWAAGVGVAAFAFGLIAKSVAEAVKGSPEAVAETKGLGANISTAEGYLGLTFLFLIVAIALYGASQVSATREEESSGRTEELFAQPVRRVGWLAGRLAVALGGMAILSAIAALLGWAGGAAGGAETPIGETLLGGLNAMPIAILFLGIGTLALGLIPRETTAVAFGAVTLTFLLAIVGETLQAPGWVLDLSPFHHLAVVPGGSIEVGASLTMVAIGAAAAALGVLVFERRDVVGP